jgi:hypothetical protein
MVTHCRALPDLQSKAEILKKQFIDGLQNKDVVMLKLYEKKS